LCSILRSKCTFVYSPVLSCLLLPSLVLSCPVLSSSLAVLQKRVLQSLIAVFTACFPCSVAVAVLRCFIVALSVALVLWYSGTLVLWYSGTLVLWFLLPLFCCLVAWCLVAWYYVAPGAIAPVLRIAFRSSSSVTFAPALHIFLGPVSLKIWLSFVEPLTFT
jgi:hypothetical protein